MFERLQKKWKVDGTQLILVLCVFAIGGSVTGYLGKIIMNLLSIEQNWLWTIVYIIVVTLIWPLNVLLVSIPFGQYSFFIRYLRRISSRMGILKKNKRDRRATDELRLTKIAIFASGAGSNAQKIINHFRSHALIRIALIVSNKTGAGVLRIAELEKIPSLIIEKEKFFRSNFYTDELQKQEIDFIVLAGFLWKIPQVLIDAFRYKIINIHPSLLPKYGGRGMYGSLVHETVISAGEKESGITIHYVDEHYDNGDIIFQEKISISADETPKSLAIKIQQLEHKNYPHVIERLILKPNGS